MPYFQTPVFPTSPFREHIFPVQETVTRRFEKMGRETVRLGKRIPVEISVNHLSEASSYRFLDRRPEL
jgi:hypothetical protein